MNEKYKVEIIDIQEHPSYFYKKRNGEYYPYFKETIRQQVNPFDISTFINILKKMDYPFFKEEWDILIERCKKNFSLQTVFGKYIAKIQMTKFKNYTFKDSKF